MPRSPGPRALASTVALLLACGDSEAPQGETGTSSSSSSSSSTSSSSGEPSSSSEVAEPTTGAAAPTVTAEVVRHETQPQVVDVIVTTSAPVPEISLAHSSDPGVVVTATGVDGLSASFRVRGLAPASEHSLQFTAGEASGTVEFTSHAALAGFLPGFEVEGSGDPAAPYRLFDLIPFPAFDTASVFMVDERGTTRWHLGGPSTGVPGPEGVWTAVQLRSDGTLMYLHEHTMWIRDELGAALLELPDDLLGVTGLHHELLELPSGNYMALSFVFQDVDYGPAGVLKTAGDLIVEFTPAGEVVWTWDSFDHLDPQRVTEPFDAAFVLHPDTLAPTYDWTHGNAIVHDAASDTLLLSLRHQDWLVAIDHKTGEVLWKLGEEGDFEFTDGAYFHHQHSPEWQADGTLLLYDNGVGDPDVPPEQVHSRAVRYALDLRAKTAKRVWSDDGEAIVVPYAGDADRLPGGRVLVTDSSITGPLGYWARLRELDEAASPMLKWSLRTPDLSFAYRGSAHDRLVGVAAP